MSLMNSTLFLKTTRKHTFDLEYSENIEEYICIIKHRTREGGLGFRRTNCPPH